MGFQAVGNYIVVAIDEEEDEKSDGFKVEEETPFRRGYVVSAGYETELEDDDEIVFDKTHAVPFGFGTDPNVVVIVNEDVVGLFGDWEEEEDDDEVEDGGEQVN